MKRRIVVVLSLLMSATIPSLCSGAMMWGSHGDIRGVSGVLPTVIQFDKVPPCDSVKAPYGSGAIDMNFPVCAQVASVPASVGWGEETIVWPWRYRSGTAVREYFQPRAVRVCTLALTNSSLLNLKVFVRMADGTVDSTMTLPINQAGVLLRVNNLIFVKVQQNSPGQYLNVLYW